MALRDECKHEHAAPQNAHLCPDKRAINNWTESEAMRFNPALPPLATETLSLVLLSSTKCHKTVSVASTLNETRTVQIQCDTAKRDEEEEEKGFLLLTTGSAFHESGFCHNLQKQQTKKKRWKNVPPFKIWSGRIISGSNSYIPSNIHEICMQFLSEETERGGAHNNLIKEDCPNNTLSLLPRKRPQQCFVTGDVSSVGRHHTEYLCKPSDRMSST